MSNLLEYLRDKQMQVVLFSSTAIALYGYDQGMMSLINTNYNYLRTMGIKKEDPMVGIIVSVYYLGCALGAVLASKFADVYGRKPGVLACVATAAVGNLIMFVAGFGHSTGAKEIMLIGRIVMGVGVGGLDSVVPVYTAELSEDDARGTALAQEFQANILGLNMAFIINVGVTHALGKWSMWAWRIPIIVMQIYPILLFSGTTLLPETPRWLIMKDKKEKAKRSISSVFGEDQVDSRMEELVDAQKKEQEEGMITYSDMLLLNGDQWHPTAVTIMGQVNQALTGYGAVSVYGPQIFGLLGFSVNDSEYLTLGNYLFYLGMMTFAWLLIDRKGRRWLLIRGSFWLAISFGLLALLGGLAMNRRHLGIPLLATGIPGISVLYSATAVFGICWLVPPWLIPTELYPSTARANGAAVSVIIWGLANFTITLITPIMFNGLKYWLFVVFCVTNALAGWWTWQYCPETGHRTFEENQDFFKSAEKEETWSVRRVKDGEFTKLPSTEDEEDGEINGSERSEDAPGGRTTGGRKQPVGERQPLLSGRSY